MRQDSAAPAMALGRGSAGGPPSGAVADQLGELVLDAGDPLQLPGGQRGVVVDDLLHREGVGELGLVGRVVIER